MKKAAIRKLLICFAMILCFLGGLLLSTFIDESLPLEIDGPESEKETDLQVDQSIEADSLPPMLYALERERQRLQSMPPQVPPQGNIIVEGSHLARHIEYLVEERVFAPAPDGLVPTPEVAIQIAEAVWLPIYGDRIYNRQPFIAQYYPRLGVWFVNGTLPSAIHHGGTAEMVIRKSDGQILSVIHTR